MSTVEEAQASVQVPPPAQAVKARGYWELIWIRLRRDKLAIAGGIFIIFMFLVAFVGAPIASHCSGTGRTTSSSTRSTEHVPPRRADDHGADAGRRLDTSSSSGPTARSVETCSCASSTGRRPRSRSPSSRLLRGLPGGAARGARRLLPRRGRHCHLAADRDDHGLPGTPVHHRDLGHRRRAAERGHIRVPRPWRVHARPHLRRLRLVLSGPDRSRPGALAAREGVRRSGQDDRCVRLADHPVASRSRTSSAR